jgi:hypothetical protein
MKRFTVLSLLLLVTAAVSGQKVDFTKEIVTIKIDTAHVIIVAELWFRNTSAHPVNQTMFCPLPIRKEGLKRDSVSVLDVSANTFIKGCRKMAAGLFYMLDFQPGEQKKVRMYDRDDHDIRSVTYQAKTQADYWQGSIPSASYTVRYDETLFVIDSTSIKPDGSATGTEGTSMTWKKTNFTPARDLTVWFHRKK